MNSFVRKNSWSNASDDQPQVPVLRITDSLIRSVCLPLSASCQIGSLKSLKLNASSLNPAAKIKTLEGLDALESLEELDISNQLLTRIDNLSHLLNLRELNLSENAIVSIQGIESLISLQVLNLNGNAIKLLPLDVFRNLEQLQVLKIMRNRIEDIAQVRNLKQLKGLTNLSIGENPFTQLIGHTQFCISEFPSLRVPLLHLTDLVLDSIKIDERQRDFSELVFGLRLDSRNIMNRKEIMDLEFNKNEGKELQAQLMNLTQIYQLKELENEANIQRISQLEDQFLKTRIETPVMGGSTIKPEQFDRQLYSKLETRCKEVSEHKDELNFQIQNLESANNRLKGRISEKEKEINESADIFFQLKNSNSQITQIRNNNEMARLSAEKDDLEMQIKQKEASLSQCFAELEKLKYLSNDCSRLIEQTRDKIDKTRSVILRLDVVSKECEEDRNDDNDSSLSEIEDERAILDSKITTLYSKLSTEQEKSNNFLYLLNQINHEVMNLSQEIEEMKKQRQDSYMKVQKTIKTAESEQEGISSNNDKLKDVSGNISYLQNELGQLQRKYQENNQVLKDLQKQYKRSCAEYDQIDMQKRQQQESLRAAQIASQVTNTYKKKEKDLLVQIVEHLKDVLNAYSQKQVKFFRKKCRDSMNRVDKMFRDINSADPAIENVLSVIDELASVTRGVFAEIDEAMTEDGLLLDERMAKKQEAFERLQEEMARFESERDHMTNQIMQCYDEYVLEPQRKKAKRDETNNAQLPPANFFSEGDPNVFQTFEAIGVLMKQVEKSEAAIKNFTNVKAQFFEEFEKETQDLAAKWKELENKKNQQKTKINAERDLLYRSIEEEQSKVLREKEKVENEKENLRQERQKAFSEQQTVQNEMSKLKKRENEFTESMREGSEQEAMNKRSLEMNVYQLKAHLSRLQASADETVAQKNIAEKELQRINNIIRTQSGKLEHEREHREQSEKLERVMEDNLQRMQFESEELQAINSKLLDQKSELLGEIKKFEVEMKIIIGKFEGEEASYKQKLRDLELKMQEKRRNLYLVEQVIAEKEINVARMERMAEEYQEAQEKYKELKADTLHYENILAERKMKIEEGDLTLKHIQAQQSTVKSHINNLNAISTQKQADLLNEEKRIKEIHAKILEAELMISKLESQQRYLMEEVAKFEKVRLESKQDILSTQGMLEELKQQVDVSSKELTKLRGIYSTDEKKFKSLMEENHMTLQSIRENIESREILYNDLTNKTETAASALLAVESNLKSILNEISLKQQSLEQLSQLSVDQEAATDRINYLNELQIQLEKQLESIQQFLQENHSEADSLEAYIEELKDEAKQLLNRIKAMNKAEDTYYIQMSLRGEQLSDTIEERVNLIMEVYSAAVEQGDQENHGYSQQQQYDNLQEQLAMLSEENIQLKEIVAKQSVNASMIPPRDDQSQNNEAQKYKQAFPNERVERKQQHEEKEQLEVPSTQEYPGGLCFSLGPPTVSIASIQNSQPQGHHQYERMHSANENINIMQLQQQQKSQQQQQMFKQQQNQMNNPFISKITNSQTDEDQNLDDHLFASNKMPSYENTHDFNEENNHDHFNQDHEHEFESERRNSNQSFDDVEKKFKDVPNLLNSSSFSHDTA